MNMSRGNPRRLSKGPAEGGPAGKKGPAGTRVGSGHGRADPVVVRHEKSLYKTPPEQGAALAQLAISAQQLQDYIGEQYGLQLDFEAALDFVQEYGSDNLS